MNPGIALMGCWLVMIVTSGTALATGEKNTDKSDYKKTAEIQQKNREIMQKTVDNVLKAVPESGRQDKPPEKTGGNATKTEPRTAEPPHSLSASLPTAISQQGRDPFTTSGIMYEEMGRQSVSGIGRGFIPAQGMDNVPKMKLKGILNDHLKRGATALLEVEGAGVFLVRSGDEIGLQGIGRNQVLKVIKVDALRVEVQAGQINQVIIVR